MTAPEPNGNERSANARLSLLLQWTVVPLTLAGMGISAYLVFVHFSGVPVYCRGAGGCHLVQSSEYATLLGVPVSLLGFVLYTSVLALAGLRGAGSLADVAPVLIFGMAFSGVVYSGYLTWLELYRIYAICTWCVVSACLLAAIFLVTTAEVLVSGRWHASSNFDE